MDYFDEFVKNYDLTNPKLNYKYYHSIRVMDNMCLLAKNMNLPYKDIELAKCIGLLHDIGRFTQFAKFGNFKDSNLDHGNYAANYLEKENALKHFDIAKEDYKVVYTAIRNHNKPIIEHNLNKRELLFSKMLRDADKLDILNALSDTKIKKEIYEDDSSISKRVKSAFFNKEIIEKGNKDSQSDNLVRIFSYVYDINFNISLYIIKENRYYEKIYNRLNNKDKYKLYIEFINNYIKERVD